MTQEQYTEYEKVMTRDAPLIITEAWESVFVKSIPELFEGIKWPVPIYRFNGNAIESWRATKSFHQELPPKLSSWLKKSQKNVQCILEACNYYITNSKKIKVKKVKTTSSEKAFGKINELISLFIEGCAGLISVYWLSEWNDQNLKEGKEPLFPQEIIKKAKEIRENDTFFDDSVELVYNYLDIISENEHWPKEVMKFLLLSELKEAIDSKQINFNKINQRKKGYAYFDKKLFLADELPEMLQRYSYKLNELKSSEKKSNVIKGVMASPGFVLGRIVRIFNREQLNKINYGDILVAPMTTPWYVPAMEKAIAFVTDEGGILCHATITAREMKKPCIIGTKIATKVLKDGDLVEVDADKGIVNVIKRK